MKRLSYQTFSLSHRSKHLVQALVASLDSDTFWCTRDRGMGRTSKVELRPVAERPIYAPVRLLNSHAQVP